MSNKDFDGPATNSGTTTPVVEAGGPSEDTLLLKECLTAIQACLDQMKVLIAANNDITILTEIETQLMSIFENILAGQETQVEILNELMALCEKLLSLQESMQLLCEKIEEGNVDQLACLEDIKTALVDVLTALECLNEMKESLSTICDKLDKATELLSSLCDKLDAILAAVIASTAAIALLKECNSKENEAILEKQCLVSDLLASVKRVKAGGVPEANYEGATRYINGRPQASSPWELVDNTDPANQVIIASGANLNEFTADLESKGYTEWSTGEEHWICPCPPGLTFESTGAYFVNVAGETSAKLVCTPIEEAPDVPVEKLAVEDECVLAVEECNSSAILEALQAMAEGQELANAKLCLIENNTNTAAPCAEPVPEEGLNKDALTLTISGDLTANYPEGQAINLQNANAEPCGTATSAGGATFDGTVTVIPITECELDEGKEPLVIVMAQPVRQAVAVAIKTVKTLTAVRTITKTAEKV